eukprot:1176151-Prorocentrum_minimum.AAC.2
MSISMSEVTQPLQRGPQRNPQAGWNTGVVFSFSSLKLPLGMVRVTLPSRPGGQCHHDGQLGSLVRAVQLDTTRGL